MCGIAGFVGPGNISDLKAMTARLSHRGPDGLGLYQDPDIPVFLGHRRLAVIDIAGGLQPMWDADNLIGIVFNGEIYNHVELRSELERMGYKFLSNHSDTEVLVNGFLAWGNDLPSKLNGMFAFAIFDRRKRRLFLARDRMGEKPLYYCVRKDSFMFASELSAFPGHANFHAEANCTALKKLLAYGFLPAPITFYKSVHKLGHGQSLTLDIDTGDVKTTEYWQFRLDPSRYTEASEESLNEEFRDLVAQSVKRRMISDVPLGVMLSGGLDSSVIAQVAASKADAPIKTFTIGFQEPTFDESKYAETMATRLATDHHVRMLSIEDAKDLIPEVLTKLDEPFADPSILPTYLLCQFAREEVTVALTGDGGDELFAGYDPFAALAPARRYQTLVPKPVHTVLRSLIDLLPVSGQNMGLDFKLRRVFRGLDLPASSWNPSWLGPASLEEMEEVFREPVDARDIYSEAITLWETSLSNSDVDRTLEFYTNLYLPENILMKADRASMMNGLELRAPFLDPEILSFAMRLPPMMKYRSGERKVLLRRAARDTLPAAILQRRKKGFGIPVADWLREIECNPVDTWSLPLGMDQSALDNFAAAHNLGRSDHRGLLWMSLVLSHHSV
jgi:asparagine synthase (glutamine-hydrolysing)